METYPEERDGIHVRLGGEQLACRTYKIVLLLVYDTRLRKANFKHTACLRYFT